MERVLLCFVFVLLAFVGNSQQRGGLGFPSDFEQAEIKVFPNPATDYFQITQIPNARRVVIRNVGSSVKTFPFSVNTQYDVTDLPAGMHSVVILDEKGKIIKVLPLQIGGFRP
jgi:hypothetical protein